MRDPEKVAGAQRAAARLEAAWERWRTEQDLADTPAQPVVGYVGYALKEPWGQPRAVIGFSADEAERLAAHLEHDTAGAQPTEKAEQHKPASEKGPAEPKIAAQRRRASGPQPVNRQPAEEPAAAKVPATVKGGRR